MKMPKKTQIKAKTVSESAVEISQLMMPNDANPQGLVHGGVILSLADKIAYACSSKHAGHHCVTASVDKVDFKSPIKIGQLVTLKASVNYVGHSSIEVGIRITAQDLITGEITHTNTCFFTMVALDRGNRPVEVPRLILETGDEKRRFKEGEARRQIRLKARERI